MCSVRLHTGRFCFDVDDINTALRASPQRRRPIGWAWVHPGHWVPPGLVGSVVRVPLGVGRVRVIGDPLVD